MSDSSVVCIRVIANEHRRFRCVDLDIEVDEANIDGASRLAEAIAEEYRTRGSIRRRRRRISIAGVPRTLHPVHLDDDVAASLRRLCPDAVPEHLHANIAAMKHHFGEFQAVLCVYYPAAIERQDATVEQDAPSRLW